MNPNNDGALLARVPSSTAEALRNYVIVKNITGFLDAYDVEACYRVNRMWHRILVDSIKPKYTIRLSEPNFERADCHWDSVDVKLELRIPTKPVKIRSVTLSQVMLELSSVKSKDIAVIGLRTDFTVPEIVVQMLRLLRKSIVHLTFGSKQHQRLYPINCTNLFQFLETLPNIRTLSFSGRISLLKAGSAKTSFNKITQLKSITFPEDSGNIYERIIFKIVHAAEDLQNVYNFPLRLNLNNYELRMIKTLSFPNPMNINLRFYENLNAMTTVPGRLEHLKINLYFSSRLQNYLRDWKRVFSGVLYQNRHTLTSLELQPTEAMGFLDFPILESLTFLRLTDKPQITKYTAGSVVTFNKFFRPDVDVNGIFPNVTELEISVHIPHNADPSETFNPVDIFNEYFPGENFQPRECWKTLQTLKLTKTMAPVVIKRLSVLFPYISRLEFITDVSLLKSTLPLIWEFYSTLEVIIIKVELNQDSYKNETLDAAVTGISEGKCRLFRDFPELFQQKDCTGISINNMKGLRFLKFIFDCVVPRKTFNFAPLLSKVSFSKGFDLLPHLNVSIGVSHSTYHRDEIVSMLRPIRPFVLWSERDYYTVVAVTEGIKRLL